MAGVYQANCGLQKNPFILAFDDVLMRWTGLDILCTGALRLGLYLVCFAHSRAKVGPSKPRLCSEIFGMQTFEVEVDK